MSNYSFNIKQNDTSPTLSVIIADSTGTAISLASASVVFKMRAVNSSSLKVNTSATITNASNGAVSYTFSASNTDTAGLFQGEFQVTYSGGLIETFPNSEYISINILDDLDS
tara:strand:+ start:235 stop:570 length:336 start_codon:yes stop_codon:yes gene_type:complete